MSNTPWPSSPGCSVLGVTSSCPCSAPPSSANNPSPSEPNPDFSVTALGEIVCELHQNVTLPNFSLDGSIPQRYLHLKQSLGNVLREVHLLQCSRLFSKLLLEPRLEAPSKMRANLFPLYVAIRYCFFKQLQSYAKD